MCGECSARRPAHRKDSHSINAHLFLVRDHFSGLVLKRLCLPISGHSPLPPLRPTLSVCDLPRSQTPCGLWDAGRMGGPRVCVSGESLPCTMVRKSYRRSSSCQKGPEHMDRTVGATTGGRRGPGWFSTQRSHEWPSGADRHVGCAREASDSCKRKGP